MSGMINTKKRGEVMADQDCIFCNGKAFWKCVTCGGDGYRSQTIDDEGNEDFCIDCHGDGVIECDECQGTGKDIDEPM